MKMSREATHFLVRSIVNPRLVLTTLGEFLDQSMLGPGGRSAKLYKTRRGAENATSGRGTVHACNDLGVEIEFLKSLP